jgi:carboxyl-terminal processing protease
MKLLPLVLSACIATTAWAEEPPAPKPSPTPLPTLREAVDALDESQIQKAIDALTTNYLSPETLDDASRQRALLEGLLLRLGAGADLNQTGNAISQPIPFLAEILDGRIGYIRPGAMDAAALKQTDSALGNFAEKSIPAVILDLRGIPGGAEFDTAADFARRFCPKGKILFTIEKPNAKQERILTADRDAVFHGILVVLADANTTGAAEALAATLRANANGMIVGAKTAGGAVESSEFPIGGGKTIRLAVSRVSLPGSGPIFPAGVKPDIEISLPAETQEKIFELTKEKGVSQFVFDTERPRMNEAALVANTNPEISAAPEAAEATEPLRDTVLQRAVDLVTAISFYKK